MFGCSGQKAARLASLSASSWPQEADVCFEPHKCDFGVDLVFEEKVMDSRYQGAPPPPCNPPPLQSPPPPGEGGGDGHLAPKA